MNRTAKSKGSRASRTLGLLLVATLATTGCSRTAEAAFPPTAGNHVTNHGATGEAEIWGVHFTVDDPRGTMTSSKGEGTFSSDPGATQARNETILGDVEIVLETRADKTLDFELNGTPYGILEVGDEVAISKDRVVTVGGVVRAPE